MGRRGCLAALVVLVVTPAYAAAPVDEASNVRPANVGQPLGSVELFVPEPKGNAFLHDLADFADYFSLTVYGDPAGIVEQGRQVLLVWFTRPDGLAVLVTDAADPGRMQAFFYIGPGGFSRDHLLDVMRGYRTKMSGYAAYSEPASIKPGAAKPLEPSRKAP